MRRTPLIYLGDALGNDVIRECWELLLQLMEQLHDGNFRAGALPHLRPPLSSQLSNKNNSIHLAHCAHQKTPKIPGETQFLRGGVGK